MKFTANLNMFDGSVEEIKLTIEAENVDQAQKIALAAGKKIGGDGFGMMVYPQQTLRDAFHIIKPHGVEVEYVESGTFQGGEEESFLKGASRYSKGDAIVFHPDWEKHCSDESSKITTT